jgi:3-hydroxyacyl-[acyl-carrier-protein] dehydratase
MIMSTEVRKTIIDIEEIIKLIPHRYPILLVDKIVELELNEYIIGQKNVTFNEPFFQGHFPDRPIMPGVLIIEAMAQTSAVLVVKTLGGTEDKLVYFMSIENAKFRKPVVPGDVLLLKLEKTKNRGNVWRFAATATVDGVKVAEAEITAMIVDK